MSGTIFVEPWWLDAVAPGQWGEARFEKGGRLAARMPWVRKKRGPFTILTMPRLTQTLGPVLDLPAGKYTNLLAHQKDAMHALIDALPPFDYFQQNFHYSVENWLPFYWRGFDQTTRYTYVIDDLTDPERVWSETRENVRTDVRKAAKSLVVRDDYGIDVMIDLVRRTFARQNRQLPYSEDLVRRIDQACAARNRRTILVAEDSVGRRHAAVYLIHDDQTTYYLLGGGDPDLRSSGATSFLLWDGIRRAAAKSRTFDFEGSMVEGIERFVRSWGARQKPYSSVSRIDSPLLYAAISGREFLQRLNRRRRGTERSS